jgi:hypothetical protein
MAPAHILRKGYVHSLVAYFRTSDVALLAQANEFAATMDRAGYAMDADAAVYEAEILAAA